MSYRATVLPVLPVLRYQRAAIPACWLVSWKLEPVKNRHEGAAAHLDLPILAPMASSARFFMRTPGRHGKANAAPDPRRRPAHDGNLAGDVLNCMATVKGQAGRIPQRAHSASERQVANGPGLQGGTKKTEGLGQGRKMASGCRQATWFEKSRVEEARCAMGMVDVKMARQSSVVRRPSSRVTGHYLLVPGLVPGYQSLAGQPRDCHSCCAVEWAGMRDLIDALSFGHDAGLHL